MSITTEWLLSTLEEFERVTKQADSTSENRAAFIIDRLTATTGKDAELVKEWRCFWCDETFTDEAEAREHFGTQEGEICACKLTKDEKGLVGLLRDAWKRLDEFYREDNASCREFHALGAKHSTELREAEQTGYDKGLADGRALSSPITEPAKVGALTEEEWYELVFDALPFAGNSYVYDQAADAVAKAIISRLQAQVGETRTAGDLAERFLACRIFRDGKYIGWKISGKGSVNELARELDPEHQKDALSKLRDTPTSPLAEEGGE